MVTTRASDLPVLIINGVDSPRSRIGRGLESVGSMTADTLQRISTTVGGVVKSPVVLLAKVGGLASPRAPALTAPPISSLGERLYHLENQMKSLEEKFNPMMEVDQSTHLHKEKIQFVKSTLQESKKMDIDKTLEKRVHMLEDQVNERLDRFEKALSSIQSRLDHIELTWRENVAQSECQESLLDEPQYYDAEQQSDNFEAQEATRQNSFGGSPILEKSQMRETLTTPPTIVEHIKSLEDIDGGNDDVLDPQIVSTPVYSKEAFLTQSVKSVTPSSELEESDHRNDVGNFPISLDQQLASSLEELHDSFVTQSSTASASAKFLEIARAVTADRSFLAHASSELESTFVLKESQETFPEGSLANSKEDAKEDTINNSGIIVGVVELPSPPTIEATQEDFSKEPLLVEPSIKLVQDLATQEAVIALASSEPCAKYKLTKEVLVGLPNAKFEELVRGDNSDNKVTMSIIGESPKALAFQDLQEDFAKDSLAHALGVEPTHECSSQEDLTTTSDRSLASSKLLVASKSMEEPQIVGSSANSEEFAQDSKGEKIVGSKLPLASFQEEPQEESTPSVQLAQVQASQDDIDKEVATLESQKNVAEIIGPMMEATKLSLASLSKESKEGFGKESMVCAPSCELEEEHNNIVSTSAFVEEALGANTSTNSKECEQKVDGDESVTISASEESASASSFDNPKENFVREFLATALSTKLVEESAIQEDNASQLPLPTSYKGPHDDCEKFLATIPNARPIHQPSSQDDLGATGDNTFTSFKPEVVSKFTKETSIEIPSGNSKELAQEDGVVKSDPMIAHAESPLAFPLEESQEGFEKDSSATTSSGELAQGDGVVKSDPVIANVEPPLASPLEESQEGFEKESSASTSSGELVQEDGAVKSDPMIADVEPPLASLFEEPQDGFEKEFLAATSSGELAQGLALEEDSHLALTCSKSQGSSKSFEEDSHTAKEIEYKLAEDFKVHHEHIKSIEDEIPKSQSNLAHGGFNENLGTKDSDDHLESHQSSEEFFDVEHGSGNFEPCEFGELKSFEEFSVELDEYGEAMGINGVAKKETLVPASSYVELAQEPEQVPKQELEENCERNEQVYAKALGQEPEQQSIQELRQELGQEPKQQSIQELRQELGHKLDQQPTQEPELEDLNRNGAMALPPLESQITSKSMESQEVLAEESLVAIPSTKFEEPTQANAIDESGIHDLPLTSTMEESKIDIVVSPGKSLSSALFHQSSNLELLENHDQKSSDIPITSSTPHEALESEALESEALEPELEESKEALANELVEGIPSSKSTNIVQEVGDGESGATLASSKPQLTPTLEESDEGFIEESLANEASTSKPLNLEESLSDKPLAIIGAKLVEENIGDKSSTRLVEETLLTPIAEEPQDGSVNSLVEGKLGQDEAHEECLEDVKIVSESTKEAIPRTKSDLTHVKTNDVEAIEDSTTMLQSQKSFLALEATLVNSKEALTKELLSSTKLSELLKEEDDNSQKREDLEPKKSSITSIIEEESQKPLVVEHEQPLVSAKSVPKGHARRWRGFARSLSEPQFAYKLEEHRKALANESPVASSTSAIPSTSKLGEDHALEDFGDVQCLPFRTLGEGKHPQKESEFKLVEDVKSLAMKSETISSSPYVLEPKPSKIKEKKKEKKEKKRDAVAEEKAVKEKKKKEKKEKKLDVATEEKERRLSLDVGELDRKSSLRTKEKGSKYSSQVEEKQKQPFKHLRDRLRHAFSINKEP